MSLGTSGPVFSPELQTDVVPWVLSAPKGLEGLALSGELRSHPDAASTFSEILSDRGNKDMHCLLLSLVT